MDSNKIDEAEPQPAQRIDQAGRPMLLPTPITVVGSPRIGGQWKGRVRIAADFDSLPDEIAAEFGIDN